MSEREVNVHNSTRLDLRLWTAPWESIRSYSPMWGIAAGRSVHAEG